METSEIFSVAKGNDILYELAKSKWMTIPIALIFSYILYIVINMLRKEEKKRGR